MKKNVEKLDELEDALKRAQDELIVCSSLVFALALLLCLYLYINVYFTSFLVYCLTFNEPTILNIYVKCHSFI